MRVYLDHTGIGIGDGDVCMRTGQRRHPQCSEQYKSLSEQIRRNQRIILALAGGARVIVDRAEDIGMGTDDTARIQRCADDIHAIAELALIMLDTLDTPVFHRSAL